MAPMPTGRSEEVPPLPWSPTYVKGRDRSCERDVGRLLSSMGYEVEQARQELSRWDLRARKGRAPWSYIEVKNRPDIDWDGRYMRGQRVTRIAIDGPLITASKAEALLRLGPVWLVVVPSDRVARIARVSADRLATYAVDAKDTNVVNKPRGDLKDKAIAKYVIPWEHFRVLRDIDDDLGAPSRSSEPPTCYACRKKHDKEFLCRPMTEYLWAIVKGGNRDSKSWRWARARLGLDEARVDSGA